MGFFWTQNLEDAVNGGLMDSGTVDVRVALLARAPLLGTEVAQLDEYRSVTTMADLLSRPGWDEVSVPGYARTLNAACTFTISGANTYLTLNDDVTVFTLDADSQVEAVALSVQGTALGVQIAGNKQIARAQGMAYSPTITVSNVTNAPKASMAEGVSMAYDAACTVASTLDTEYVICVVDTPFRQRGRTIFQSGDGITAQDDLTAGVKWYFGWATSGGELTAVAEGPVSVALGAPHFESSRLQHVWMFPQRVNYAANPSFEYSSGFWQCNAGALVREANPENYPSPYVGSATGLAPVTNPPQYHPEDRLYVQSAGFFPQGRTHTFQVMAKGTGVARVALSYYNRDYTDRNADWGNKDDFFFQEWELSPDHFTRLQGIRSLDDAGYEAALLIEVRGYLTDPDDFDTYQVPDISIDMVTVEEGTLLDWPYFDGDTTYGATGDFSWYGLDSADKQGKSYSLWYNNMRDINGRLFARRVDDTALYTSTDEQLDSMLSQWVPAGVNLVPHWGALSSEDTFLPPVDDSGTSLTADTWPEQTQFFDIFEVVEASQTGITLRVIGEGGHPISRAFVISGGTTVVPVTIAPRPWEAPGLRANQIDALLAELYDLSIAQTVVMSWDAVPAFASNTLYIERGDARSPQSVVTYQLLSAAGSGFGEATALMEQDVDVDIRVTLPTAASTGTAYGATTAYGMLAETAEGVGTAYIVGPGSVATAEMALGVGSADEGVVQYGIRPDAGTTTATSTAYNATCTVDTEVSDIAATGAISAASVAAKPTPTTGIGSSVANNVTPVLNDAPNPVTGLGVTYATSGASTWNAVANWTLPGDVDLASVKVRWTINAVAGSWIVLAASATSHTQAATSGVTHTVEVQTFDTNGQGSVSIPSAAGGSSPLDAVPTLTLTQTGLDQLTATWTHPSGNNRSGYTVVASGGVTSSTTEASGTTTKVFTVTPDVSTTVTVTPQDNTSGTRNGRSKSATGTAVSAAPGTPTVSSWSFSSITITWTQPTWHDGGYYVERSIGAGSFTVVSSAQVGNTFTEAVSADTNYRYRVRARGTTNYSAYSGNLQPAIGHAAYDSTSAWSGVNSSVNLYYGHPDGVNIPADVVTDVMTVHLDCTFATSLMSGTGTRNNYYVEGYVQTYPTGTKANPWDESFAWVSSTPGLAGINVSGSGWSNTSTGGYRATGSIGVTGTLTTHNPQVNNSYW